MLLDGTIHHGTAELEIRNPVTSDVVGRVSRDTTGDVSRVLERMAGARGGPSAQARSHILHAASAALNDQRDRFARLISGEAGTCIKEAQGEVDRACRNLTVAGEEAIRLHGESLRIESGGEEKLAITVHEPISLICAITPFNRPLNQVVVKVAPAIAAGASIIVKPSELTPLSALAFVELLLECGLPPLTVSVLTGVPSEIGPALLTSPLVGMVTFTGSTETGERIVAQVGLKKTLMELGGNDPLIVLADADLPRSATLAATGAFANAGQSCRGVKRIIAVESVADRLVELLVEETRQLKLGDILDPTTDVGAMISTEAAASVERRCEEALAHGATLMHGGTRDGPMMTPTVLDRVSAHSKLVVKETLGPVAPVLRVRDVEEALKVANGTCYGLQAGVVTRDVNDFMYLARRLRFGAVNLGEGPQFDSPHIPFGGVKRSGIGREGIRWTIREMCTVKTIVLPVTPTGGGEA